MNIRATSIGLIASRALREGARGVVRSLFERSFYVSIGEAWICVGPPALGAGPLNVLCAPAPLPPFSPTQTEIQRQQAGPTSSSNLGPRFRGDERKGNPFGSIGQYLAIGETASVLGGILRIGNTLSIDLGGAAVWSPSPAGNWDAMSLARGLAAFDTALPDDLPRDGLALLLRPLADGTLPPVARVARGPSEVLASLVRSSGLHSPLTPAQAGIHGPPSTNDPDPRWSLPSTLIGRGDERKGSLEEQRGVRSLLGLGPGLTPSGDDFLAGAMVALTCLGMTPLRDALWAALAPLSASHTNRISCAHLGAAAEGLGSAALHALLDAVIAGDSETVPERLATLAAVGHTSGWDAMAGALTVLRAVIQ